MRALDLRSKLHSRRWLVALGASSCAALLALLPPACVPNPSIDGSKVPPIGSDANVPTCEPLCQRLAALCGYAPVDCVARCDSEFADEQRVCMGQAANCRAALQECAPPEEEEDAGEEEEDAEADGESEEDAEAEDAAEDGAIEEDAGPDGSTADASADVANDG